MLDSAMLTATDYQILRWRSEGLSTRAIATRLGRSIGDVERRLDALSQAERLLNASRARRAESRPRKHARDRHSALRERVLAQWRAAAAYLESRNT